MELRIDSRSFTNLAKAVRAAEPQLRTGLLAGLRAGEISLQRTPVKGRPFRRGYPDPSECALDRPAR